MRTDLWRCAVVDAPIAQIVRAGSLDGLAITLLPDPGPMRILADPFGVACDDRLHVFAEAMGYADRHGTIEHLELGPDGTVLARKTVLRTASHLSYPIVLQADGAFHMLPEASRSGRLSLYRAARFPDVWTPVETFAFPENAIDATPVFHEGLWWMFYTPTGDRGGRQSTLCAAWAETLTGPWQPHPANPLRVDPAGARPGGTAFVEAGRIVLPTQDCRGTYGAAIRVLFVEIDRHDASLTEGPRISPPASLAPYTDGLHTLSGVGARTLIDVKRVRRGPGRHILDLRRRFAGK